MELSKMSKQELLIKCEELGITKCKSKNKNELIELINKQHVIKKPSFIIEDDDEDDDDQENLVIKIDDNKLTLVDLFSGTGAFSYAFHLTNKVKTIFANDMLDSSEEIFNLNNDLKLTKLNLNEIKDCNIPKSNILTGGFPCQPFSIAGMQKGFEDERSNVFWKILSIIKTNSPEIVILENVKNLQSHDNGNTFKTVSYTHLTLPTKRIV